MRHAVAQADFVNRSFRFLRAGDVNRFAVGRPGDRIDPILEIRREMTCCSACPVVNPQLPKIGLISGPRLRAPGDPAAVRRVFRTRVCALTRRDSFRFSTGDRHDENVAVCGDLRMVRSVAGVRELLAVGRDLELVAAAKRERRRVVSARGEIARRAAGERNVNDVRPRRLLPRFPMAIEKVGDDASLGRFLLRRSRFVLDARRIDAALRIDVGHER